jgi:hypothetical protein
MFCPRMGKVDDKNQLNQDEEKGSSQAEVHPLEQKKPIEKLLLTFCFRLKS